jgi:hypothetical protein
MPIVRRHNPVLRKRRANYVHRGMGNAVLPNVSMMSPAQATAFQSNDVTVSLAAVKAAFPDAVSWFYDVDGVPIVDYGSREVRLSCTWPDRMPYTAQYGTSLSRPLPNGQQLYLMAGCPAPSGPGAAPAGFGMNVSTVTPAELAAAQSNSPNATAIPPGGASQSNAPGAAAVAPTNWFSQLFNSVSGGGTGSCWQLFSASEPCIGPIGLWTLGGLGLGAFLLFSMGRKR